MNQRLFSLWQRNPIPPFEGFLFIELSKKPVPYRIARCFAGQIDARQCHALALSSCHISCMATDMVRGRLPRAKLQRSVTSPCLRKLDTMAMLRRGDNLPGQGHPMGTLPVIPQSLHGMLVSPTRIEVAVHLTIGLEHHWVNLILQETGSRWMCVMVDVG